MHSSAITIPFELASFIDSRTISFVSYFFMFISIRCLMDAKNIYLMLSKTKEHEEEGPSFGRQKNINAGMKSGMKYEKLMYKIPRKASMTANGTLAK
jgi:hypothetical protein